MAMKDVTRLTRFTNVMAEKLEINSYKKDWRNTAKRKQSHQVILCEWLSRLNDEVSELRYAILKLGDGSTNDMIIREAADVANFAMMIADLAFEEKEPT